MSKYVFLFLAISFMSTSTSAQLPGNPFDRLGDTRFNTIDQSYLFAGKGQLADALVTGPSRSITGHFILTAHFQLNNPRDGQFTGWKLVTEDGRLLTTAYINHEGKPMLMAGGKTITGLKKKCSVLQVEVQDGHLFFRAAITGEPLQLIADAQITPNGALQATPFATGTSNVTISNIRIDRPVAADHDPDKSGYVGSRLEVLDITSGHRRVIWEKNDRFEAPNFMPDGKKLLFNMDGLLYTIPVTVGTPTVFPTGFANRNNNDHGISFDGKWLALSHHRDGMPDFGSTVYVMPLSGGEPRLITEETPSYWHGWSADNRQVLYVAKRNGSPLYHIYQKPIDGGKEVRLTDHTFGHVDGPEYSPDGKWIYYNGSQTGTMQLWRMRPDGSGKEQLTFDENNNWFPHISPDGKWIAYLAFLPDINPDDHPAYKQVTLRLMPASGGAPRVLAYLYGGQGTINVPSWSPDSKTIAFVSNSQRKTETK